MLAKNRLCILRRLQKHGGRAFWDRTVERVSGRRRTDRAGEEKGCCQGYSDQAPSSRGQAQEGLSTFPLFPGMDADQPSLLVHADDAIDLTFHNHVPDFVIT